MTAKQESLFVNGGEVDNSGSNTIQKRFLRFHKENPRVYDELVALCRKAKKAGHTRVGVKMLWEVMRWNIWLQIKTDETFKLNNVFTSRYARLIMDTEPDLKNVFELRILKRS